MSQGRKTPSGREKRTIYSPYKKKTVTTSHLQTKRPRSTQIRATCGFLWLVNNGERTRTSQLALGYPVFGPPRHLRAYYCVQLSNPGFLCCDSFHHEMFYPLLQCPGPLPLVLGCSRPLVGVDAESSEVKQTRCSLFFLTPHTARALHQNSEYHAHRQTRILHARHKSSEQDPPPA